MAGLTPIELLLPELRAYARSLCTSADDAEDLVQDAVERALRADTRPEKPADLRPWMFRVIRNLHLDELRRRRIRLEYHSGEKRLSDDNRGTADMSRDVLIRLTFEKLPPEKREILFLVDVIGMTYAEAAGIIGVPHGTVMSRVSRARRELREAIDGAGDTPAGDTSKAKRK